jgi:hypothetical protein
MAMGVWLGWSKGLENKIMNKFASGPHRDTNATQKPTQKGKKHESKTKSLTMLPVHLFRTQLEISFCNFN